MGNDEYRPLFDALHGARVTVHHGESGLLAVWHGDRMADVYSSEGDLLGHIILAEPGAAAPEDGPARDVMLAWLEQRYAELLGTSTGDTDDAETSVGPRRVLLADDEEQVIRMLTQMLEPLGYEVIAHYTGQGALEEFCARPNDFDLVITDHVMPRMTGAALANELRRIRPDLPMVLMSGFSDMVTPEKARDLGFGAYLMKPFRRQQLAAAIDAAVVAARAGEQHDA